MNQRALQRGFRAFAARAVVMVVATAATVVGAGDGTAALEQRLSSARPDILRWQTQPLNAVTDARREADIIAVGRVAARVPVRYADGHVAWFAVAGFRPVLVSTHALEIRSAIEARDAAFEERDVLVLGCEPLSSLDPATRWRTTRRLGTATPLCAGDLERVPDVERDRPVTLTTQRGAVRVSRLLTAAADARAGERVRLLDRNSGDTLIAIVTGPGHARDPDSEELR
jgi:flagella basal body P-ring formation protein FlgA